MYILELKLYILSITKLIYINKYMSISKYKYKIASTLNILIIKKKIN